MKNCFLLINFILCTLTIQGQISSELLKKDTVHAGNKILVINYPSNYIKHSESNYGDLLVIYISEHAPQSAITLFVGSNFQWDENILCIQYDTIDSEKHTTVYGYCDKCGFYRRVYFKKSLFIVSYECISNADKPYFDFILDSIEIISNN